ncbi:MAG: vacJ [Gammaproteobacteria bacterium]|nr:vacJ [Gammaproteobacteria bacterium]
MSSFQKFFFFSLLALNLSAFADNTSNDPYESFNRHTFAMNQTVDKVIYKPVATIYKTVMPDFAEQGVSNFFNNLAVVPTIANDLLQFKLYDGTHDTWRLLVNSTLGVFGLFDVASKIGLTPHYNDFGTTMAKYGFRNSNYFVIPFLGPSTVRDTFGFGVDTLGFSVYPYIEDVPLRNGLVILNFVQTRAQLLQFQEVVNQAAVDPYTFQRNAYLQRRSYVLTQNLGESASENNGVDDADPYVA